MKFVNRWQKHVAQHQHTQLSAHAYFLQYHSFLIFHLTSMIDLQINSLSSLQQKKMTSAILYVVCEAMGGAEVTSYPPWDLIQSIFYSRSVFMWIHLKFAPQTDQMREILQRAHLGSVVHVYTRSYIIHFNQTFPYGDLKKEDGDRCVNRITGWKYRQSEEGKSDCKDKEKKD